MFTANILKDVEKGVQHKAILRQIVFETPENIEEGIRLAAAYWKMRFKVYTELSLKEVVKTKDIVEVSNAINIDLIMLFGIIMGTKSKKRKKEITLKNIINEKYRIIITFGDD